MRTAAVAFAAVVVLGGCASLGDLAGAIRRPTIHVVGAEVESLDFEGARLRFDVRIDNPNPVGIELAGYDYELTVDGTSFIEGLTDREVGLAANGSSIVPIPVEFEFQELLDVVQGLRGRDEAPYRLSVGLSFRVPVLEQVRLTATRDGTFPVVRLPRVRVLDLQVERVTLQEAALLLRLELANPNGFAIDLDALSYDFRISGRRWAYGVAERGVRLDGHGRARFDLPLRVNFVEVGLSVREVLTAGGPLAYELEAVLGVRTPLTLLPRADIPIGLRGQVRLGR
jgi:LEA14-like dessication related protein